MGTLRPLVFIGCGGSGGKTLRFAHDAIMRRLRRSGWTGDMPAAWQFLWIDVPMEQEGGEEFGNALPGACYTGLVKPSTSYQTGIDQAVMSIRNVDPMELVGWRPNPSDVHILIEDGAGQFRAIGRMISVREGAKIADGIRSAFNATTDRTALIELNDVAELLGGVPGQEPRAFLVSSLAGGSGAGTFLDVADILAIESGSTNSAPSTTAILYTADVFTGDKSISGVEGVEGNSLAALSELVAGYWSEDPRSLTLFRSQGVSSGNLTRGGIGFPFLVGATNASGVTLGSATEVYRSIGESLALITVSSDVQETFTAFLTTQWPQSGVANGDLLGLQGPYEVAPTSALGYSRIGLGRDRFQEYAVRRLTRCAIEFLASGYLRTGRSGQEGLTPAEALNGIVEENWLNFLNDCQLNEREKNDQIINALTPPLLDSLLKGVIVSISEKQAGAKESDLTTWLRRIQSTAALLAKDFASSFDNALNEQTLKWASEAPDRLLNTVGEYCARFGIPVVLRLLSDAKRELEEVANDLVKEAGRFNTDGGNWKGRIGQLGLPTDDRIGSNHPKMNSLVEAVTSPWRYGAHASIRERASAVMIEFAREIVAPVESALRAAQANFEADTTGRGGRPPEFMSWPKDQSVPDTFQPSKVEFLLDDVEKYPDTFINLVAASTSKDELKEGGQPLTVAVQNVIRGGFKSKSVIPIDRAIRRDLQGMKSENAPAWKPIVAHGSGEPWKVIAEFGMNDLFHRAEEWTQRPGAFRDHLEETLSGYLLDRDAKGDLIADHQKRLSTFKSKFATALATSSPLIDIDANIYSITHPNALDYARVIEPLPFPQGHPARQIAEDILVKGTKRDGGDGKTDGSEFTSTNAGIGSVGIISYFPQPMHPVVFRSVTKPIDEKLQEGVSKFWLWRRTRRLSEFIPVSSSARKAMIRGWFTARVLGILDTENLKSPIRILSESGEWLSFPHVPLGGFIDRTTLPLAAVLESLPLAWISWAAGRCGETEAYRRLMNLGISDPSQLTEMGGDGAGVKVKLFSYEEANVELVEWIQTGVGDPKSHPLAKGSDDKSRLESVMEVFDDMVKKLSGSFKLDGNDSSALLRAPRGIDLISEVIEEIERIANARYVVVPPPPVY